MNGPRSPWSKSSSVASAFASLFDRYRESIIVVSYRDNGTPSKDQLIEMLSQTKRSVEVRDYGEFQYALSTDRATREMLLIGT